MPIALSEQASLRTVVVDLTAAQVATMASSPVTVVPSPGPGGVLVPVAGIVQYHAGAVPFKNSEFLHLAVGGSVLVSARLGLDTLSDGFSSFNLDVGATLTEDAALTFFASTDPGVLGPVVTSSLDDPGSLWVPTDIATISDGTGGSVTVSTVANSFAISSLSQVGKTFTVVGDASAIGMGDSLTVYRSTGNDGTEAYTVVSAVFAAGHTVITVNEAIPSAVADGRLGDANAGSVGAISTYGLTTPGTGYSVDTHVLTAVAPSVGVSGAVLVLTITPQSDGVIRLTVLYLAATLI